MKNIVKMLGFIAFVALIGFVFVSCPEPGLDGTVNITGAAWEGYTLTANIGALGGSGLITFQWLRDGGIGIGTNSNTYVVQTADIGSSISVTVTRSDNSGSVTSAPTDIVIPVPSVTINTHPAWINVIAGFINSSISVSASATNGVTPTYQWYSDTSTSITGGNAISGATNASFSIPSTLTPGTYYYYCEVRLGGGLISVTSNVARVNVTAPAIAISSQPAETTDVFFGNISGSLSVTASFIGSADLRYQWYSSTTNSIFGDRTIILGATDANFTIPTTLTPGTYYYYCEVTDTDTGAWRRSNVATVNVIGPEITINTQPAAVTSVFEDFNGNLTVVASVTMGATLSYQWYSNTTNSNTGGSVISGAINANYVIPNTLTVGTYYYYCQVTATGGATPVNSSVAKFNVITPIEMVQVPSGSFQLGRNLGTGGGSDETPVSTVNISGFHIGKYPVTQAQYQAVMGTNPSWFHGGSGREPAEVQERRPVENVRWYDALVFCNRLSIMEGLTPAYSISGSTNPNDWGAIPTTWDDPLRATWDTVQIVSGSTGYRLPTEAQWEYAAKGGNGSPGNFTYSGSNNPNDVAWYWENNSSIISTHEVGKKAPNGLGIYDMSGNVQEWCWDWWGSYTSTAKTDPTGAVSGADRVLRGGSINSNVASVRSVFRNRYNPYDRFFSHGFRVSLP
ncbi:MAG: formylglycine-generating enzyme family protein [Treponema sp.]|nr:formylglycine-generating enzyme family protein [Treponema sp.]